MNISSVNSSIPKCVDPNTKEVFIKVCDIRGKIQHIAVSHFQINPNQCLLNRLWESLYSGIICKTSIQIHVEGEKKPSYIRTAKAAEILGCKENEICEKDAFFITQKIIQLNKFGLLFKVFKEIYPKETICYKVPIVKNLCDPEKCFNFDSSKMQRTLVKISESFKNKHKKCQSITFEDSYEVKIKKNQVTIFFDDHSQKSRKKIKLPDFDYQAEPYKDRILRKLKKHASCELLNKIGQLVCFETLHQLLSDHHLKLTPLLNTLLEVFSTNNEQLCVSSNKQKKLSPAIFTQGLLSIYCFGKSPKVVNISPSKEIKVEETNYFTYLCHRYSVILRTEITQEKPFLPDLGCIAENNLLNKAIRFIHRSKSVEEEKIFFGTLIAIEQVMQFMSEKSSKFHYSKKIQDSNQDFLITPNGIYIGLKPIAKGGFKKISEAINLKNSNEYIKASIKGVFLISKTYQEVQLLETLTSRNVVNLVEPYLETFLVDGLKYILIQRKYLGTAECLFLPNRKFSAKETIGIMMDAAKGLASMHESGYAHLDIKPANIFIDFDKKSGNYSGKIGDLGLALRIGSRFMVSTYEFLAPEAISLHEPLKLNNNLIVTNKLDSYAFGITMMQIVTQFYTVKNETVVNKWCSELEQETIDLHLDSYREMSIDGWEKTVLSHFLNICNELIQQDPEKRITCEEAAEKLKELLKICSKLSIG